MFSPELLASLKELIQERRITAGISLLEQNRNELESTLPSQPGGGLTLGYLAQWIDVGFEDEGLLSRLVAVFESSPRQKLSMEDYLQLRLAEGLLGMRRENLTDALKHLDAALMICEDLGDLRTSALAHLWKARCLRKAGEYDQAQEATRRGIDLALQTGLAYLAAVMQTLESWLLFQKGQTDAAVRVLQGAEAVLRDTDDFITLGNIQSTYGRIAMREGRYDHAMRSFDASIDYFKRRLSMKGYLARSLTNIAQAKRLLSLQLRRSMDARWERQRTGKSHVRMDKEGKTGQLERMHELLRRAQFDLGEADGIYKEMGNHHGAGNVAVNLAQISLDLGHLDAAEQESEQAFELGSAKADYVLMCRARIIQATVADARYEEQVGEEDDPSRFAQLAHDCAKDAVAFGQRIESHRLLAQALLCQGMIFANGFFHNPEMARLCCDRAESQLNHDRHDAMWQEVEILRAKILRSGFEDPNLRAWSQGAIGDKSLQDVVGEFEELLIRRVWEREEKRVSRVAHKLAVSPKKVRRVLRHLGLLAEQASPDADEEA